MLQGQAGPFNLALIGGTAQLVSQLIALSKTGGPQRMPLGQQSTRRVGHHLTAIAVVTIQHKTLSATHCTQPQGLVRQQLVMSKAVVQFDHTNVLRINAGLLVHGLRSPLRHVKTHHLNHRHRFMTNRRIGSQRLRQDHHIGVQAMFLGKRFGANDRRRRTASWRAGHQTGHDTRPDHLIVHHVFGRHNLAEQGQRVVARMTAGLGANSGKGTHLRTVLLHVLTASTAKHLQSTRDTGDIGAQLIYHRLGHVRGGTRAVIPDTLQRPGLHLLEAKGQGTVHRPALHRLTCQEQGTGAGGTVVVDVDQRDTAHADFIQRCLATGGITVDITGVGLLDEGVIQASVFQGQAHRLRTHLNIGTAGAWLDERNHTNADNVRFLRHYSAPESGSYRVH
ncbi:hypothetical protein D3C79_422640 [compost metagenome]